MMDELAARFMPKFIALARTRVADATAATRARDHAASPTTVRELHALAGEAGLLGLSDLIPLARECEQKAKELRASGAESQADALLAALGRLERAIESLAIQA